MDPMRRVLNGVWLLATIAALAAATAHAQSCQDIRYLGSDPIDRSPRMAGMGRLSLVVDDVHHRFDIWEFSGNPAALVDSDTSSTFEFYPSTGACSTVHDDLGSP